MVENMNSTQSIDNKTLSQNRRNRNNKGNKDLKGMEKEDRERISIISSAKD
jgi:hypothetical protein